MLMEIYSQYTPDDFDLNLLFVFAVLGVVLVNSRISKNYLCLICSLKSEANALN